MCDGFVSNTCLAPLKKCNQGIEKPVHIHNHVSLSILQVTDTITQMWNPEIYNMIHSVWNFDILPIMRDFHSLSLLIVMQTGGYGKKGMQVLYQHELMLSWIIKFVQVGLMDHGLMIHFNDVNTKPERFNSFQQQIDIGCGLQCTN